MTANPHNSESAGARRGVSVAQPSGLRSRLMLTAGISVVLLAMGNAHAKDPGTPTAEHLGLTPAYLQGEWCQTYIQFPKERTEENVPYR